MSVFQITYIINMIFISVFPHTYSVDDQSFAVVLDTVTPLNVSDVKLPCTFKISHFENKYNKTTYIYGILQKENNTFAKQDIIMTGDLKRNCSTVFYNVIMNYSVNSYYCRLEIEPDVLTRFKTNQTDSTESNKTVKIIVTDSPQLKPNYLPYVMEESTVNLSCSAEAPCPKQLFNISWSNIPESANITTPLLEKPDETKSVISLVTFKASYRDHKKNISCIVTYTRNTSKDSTVETNVMLRVQFPPKETNITISPSASVSAGTNVTLTCRSKGSPSSNMTFTWYKRGENRPVAERKHLTFIVTENSAGWYSCTAQNKHGNQSSEEIQLTVEIGQNRLSKTMLAACVGGIVAVILLCALSFCTRRRKKTRKEDEDGQEHSLNQIQDGTIDTKPTNSVLTVTNQDNRISGRRLCEAEDNAEEDSTKEDNSGKDDDPLCHSVTDSPQQLKLKPKKLNVMEENTVSLNCSAEAPCPKQPPTITWSNIPESANITTQLLKRSNKTQSVISLVTFKASYRDHKKNISCIVTYTRQTSKDSTVETNVTLRVQFPPKETNITISPSASVSAGTNVTLNCKSKGSPSSNMTFTWYKRGENRPVAERKHLTFIVTENNAGWYSCTAQNKHGNQSSEEIQLTVGGPIPMIVACVGGIVAVLMLSAIGFYTRIMKKTNREDSVGEKDSLNQMNNGLGWNNMRAQDGTVDSTYAEVLTVTNQDNKMSDVQSFCKNDQNTEEDSAEDDKEKGSDVVYAQVNVLLKKTQPINVQCEDIYAKVKI